MRYLLERIRRAFNGDEDELRRRREILRLEILKMLRDVDAKSGVLKLEALQLTINNISKQLQEHKV